MSNPGPSPGSGVRHCWGEVTGTGGINNPGSGDWTVAQNSAGNYTVTFTTPFKTVPAVSVDIANASITAQHNAYLSYGSVTENGFTVFTANGTVATNLVFDFVAVGT